MGSNAHAADAPPAPTLVPVSGAALFAQERARRKSLHRKGAISTGCLEIDDALLLGGGFERGCVVGVSAEDVDFGVLVSVSSSRLCLSPSRGIYSDAGYVEERGLVSGSCHWI